MDNYVRIPERSPSCHVHFCPREIDSGFSDCGRLFVLVESDFLGQLKDTNVCMVGQGAVYQSRRETISMCKER